MRGMGASGMRCCVPVRATWPRTQTTVKQQYYCSYARDSGSRETRNIISLIRIPYIAFSTKSVPIKL